MTAPSAAAPPFSLGVASFDPLAERVLIWTALDEPAPCRWEVATDPGMAQVVAEGSTEADAASGVVCVDVGGLAPGTTHWYRFTAGGRTSPTGRTRTLPAGDVERLRLAVTCCARFGQSPFTVYGAVAGTDVDVVLHLGDYIYEDTKSSCPGREPEPDHDCVTVDDYRARHAQARRDPDLQALHARHPMIVVWDDHDIADNAWRGGAATHDADEQGPWERRLDAALRAHQEYLPKRLADPGDPTSAWRRLDAGRLASIVCTENRAHRDEQAGIDGAPPADAPDRTMLGREQARWLTDAVSDRSIRWVLVLSGTVVSELVIEAPDALDRVLPEKYAIVDGKATNTDQWDGYVAERRALASALAQRGGGAVVLSGDIHSSWAIEGPLGPGGEPAAVELVCPPAATTPLGQLLPPGAGELLGPALVQQLPRVRWVDVDHHGYLTLDVGTDQIDAQWWWVEPGSDAEPRRARHWLVPHTVPMALVDPEPVAQASDAPPASPLSAQRRARRRRAAVAAAAVGALGALMRRRRVAGR